jgi:uncharacterized protein YdeI (YjbR/CyaY-like superfamily)
MNRDARVDTYIANAAPFARPVLERLRDLVHQVLPDSEETIKWSMPHFTYRGKNVAGMAAFKAHCAFTIHGEGRQSGSQGDDGMGHLGKIAGLADLPPEAELAAKLHAARDRVMAAGSAVPKPATRAPKPEISMPEDFAAALAGEPAAGAFFASLAPSHRRDYLEWITEAKSDATRHKRMAQALVWLGEGKKRHWKYEKC